MGQIIIDLPTRINRRYRLDDKKLADNIIVFLEAEALLIPNPSKLTKEDISDIRAARYARKGELVAWEDVKERLDLP